MECGKMKHTYGIVISVLGLAFISAAFFCPIIKGIIAVAAFFMGLWLLQIGTTIAGVLVWKDND
jgi:hypothetical protein